MIQQAHMPGLDPLKIAIALRALRSYYGWTLADMHQHCSSKEMPVSYSSVNNYLGGRYVSQKTINRMLTNLGLDRWKLLGWYSAWQGLDILEAR